MKNEGQDQKFSMFFFKRQICGLFSTYSCESSSVKQVYDKIYVLNKRSQMGFWKHHYEKKLMEVVEFQLSYLILKDDAVKVPHSICQQIWKTQQWPRDWKRSIFIPIPKKGNAQECSVQFSSVTRLCPTLSDPIDCSTPGLPVHHQFLELTQTHVH